MASLLLEIAALLSTAGRYEDAAEILALHNALQELADLAFMPDLLIVEISD